jgi:enoyl-CoA hydratase/carnithine racemase
MTLATLERHGNVGIITLNNPPLNLISAGLFEDLRAAVDDATGSGVRALLVRAEGSIFSAGADVTLFSGQTGGDQRARSETALPFIHAFERLPFPTVCAVQGLCLAAGLEIALLCDLIVAGESARFAQVEEAIGTTTLLGGAQRLAERAGSGRAFEIVYTGARYDAATFERWNIVNRVVPDDRLQEESLALAERLASGPTRALAAGKRLIRAQAEAGVLSADAMIDEVAAPLFESEDMRIAVRALMQHGARRFREHVTFQGR